MTRENWPCSSLPQPWSKDIAKHSVKSTPKTKITIQLLENINKPMALLDSMRLRPFADNANAPVNRWMTTIPWYRTRVHISSRRDPVLHRMVSYGHQLNADWSKCSAAPSTGNLDYTVTGLCSAFMISSSVVLLIFRKRFASVDFGSEDFPLLSVSDLTLFVCFGSRKGKMLPQ